MPSGNPKIEEGLLSQTEYCLKYLFSILTIALALNSLAETHSFETINEDRSWRLSYLNFESFLALPKSSQIEYIHLARTFLLQQELRKSAESTSMLKAPGRFLFLNSAEAADGSPLVYPDYNGRCNFVEEKSKLTKALQDIVRKGRDQCVIAGQPVCMAITEIKGEQRLVCKLEFMPAVAKELKCSDENPHLIACGGLFLNKEGQQLCVEPKVGSTSLCEKNAVKVEQLIEIFKKNKDAKKNFENEFANIRRYCGRSKDNANFIDVKDCEILNERLRQLEKEIPESDQVQFVADCTYKARAEAPALNSDLRFQFRQKGSDDYLVQISGKELKNWRTRDGVGRFRNIDHDVLQASSHKLLRITRWASPPDFIERFEPNYSEKILEDCKAAVTLKQDYFGKMKDGQCVVQLKKRDGDFREYSVPGKNSSGDDRFTDQAKTWVPEETPRIDDLFGTPKGTPISYIVTKKISDNECQFGLRWDIDGEPTPKKGSVGAPAKAVKQQR